MSIAGKMRGEQLRSRMWSLEAFCWLIAAKIAVTLLPFRLVAARLGVPGAESPYAVGPAEASRAREIRWRLRSVARRVGWHPSCLVRSVAAMMLLRREHVEGTLYLGVARDANEPLRAHAWVRCGDVFVTGEKEKDRFTVLGTFTQAP